MSIEYDQTDADLAKPGPKQDVFIAATKEMIGDVGGIDAIREKIEQKPNVDTLKRIGNSAMRSIPKFNVDDHGVPTPDDPTPKINTAAFGRVVKIDTPKTCRVKNNYRIQYDSGIVLYIPKHLHDFFVFE